MSIVSEYVAYYLERMRQGQYEDAFFGLIEDPAVLPALIDAFGRDENHGIRAEIVQCIWQHRRPETIGFLAELLHDPEAAVWRVALDGLVAIGTNEASRSEAVRALQAARTKIRTDRARRAITTEWIDEALEQLRELGTE